MRKNVRAVRLGIEERGTGLLPRHVGIPEGIESQVEEVQRDEGVDEPHRPGRDVPFKTERKFPAALDAGRGDAVDGERQREPAVRPGEGDVLPLGAAHPLEDGVRAEQHVKIAGAGAHEGDVVGKPGRKPRRIHLDRKVVGERAPCAAAPHSALPRTSW